MSSCQYRKRINKHLYRCICNSSSSKRISSGCGILNKVINKLPFELHYPKYQYLGPGTHLHKRLARGDRGINKLDEAAKRHDIYYEQNKDTKSRHTADKILENEAWDRVKAKDAKLSEKLAAYITTNAMKVKRKLGMGMLSSKLIKKGSGKRGKRKAGEKKPGKGKNKKKSTVKTLTFSRAVKLARAAINPKFSRNSSGKRRKKQVSSELELMKTTAKALKAIRGKNFSKVQEPKNRVIPIPQSGGALPLIPILAGLASISTLVANTPSIVKNIKSILGFRK